MADCDLKPKRNRIQFKIRSLLALMLLCGIVVGWFSARVSEVNREAEIYESLVSQGVDVKVLDRDLYLIEKALGRKFYSDHYQIRWFERDLEAFAEAGELSFRELSLIGPISLSDISALKNQRSLEEVYFFGDFDFSLQPLSTLTKLKVLRLPDDSNLKDLEALRNLSQLQKLILRSSEITSLGVFENYKELRHLDVQYCDQLRDVSQLSKFESLEVLGIDGGVLDRYVASGGTCDGLLQLHVSDFRGDSLKTMTASAIQVVNLKGAYLKNLDGIELFSNCKKIVLDFDEVEDISALEKLKNSKVEFVELPWDCSNEEVSKWDEFLPATSVTNPIQY